MKRPRREDIPGLVVLSAPLLWAVAFMFIPYVIIFTYSFWLKKYPTFVPAFQFGNYAQIFADPQYYQVLFRTGKIAIFVSILSLLMAYPFAYFLVFKVRSTRLRALLYMAVIAPLWVSYLLRAYTWKTILGSEGVLNSFLVWTGILGQPTDVFLYNQFSMVVTLTYIFIPFMVMPIYTALEKIPKNLVEAAGDLGVTPWGTLWKVIWPLSLPGVIAGATFTFCLTFGDFIAPFLVGGPDGVMVANVITSQYGAALNWPLGSALAIIMLIIVLAVIELSDRAQRAGRIGLG
ncbi:MAG TPA: ABC transporter permease [Aestuariivirga sp.]|nr:ABC transporter permease [Alphaproteobacteria bacterium]HRX36645.1 ABC transporter permease [Aestuariivirga sp.]